MDNVSVPVRYEFSPATGLQVQRMDSDICDCDVPGYGLGTDIADAREYVALVGGKLLEFAYPATK